VDGALRPVEHLAGRFCALLNLFLYVASSEEKFPESEIRAAIRKHGLANCLTVSEEAVMNQSRADANAKHLNSIGWKLENMMALAWILGIDTPLGLEGTMAGGDEIDAMTKHSPPLAQPWTDYLKSLSVRDRKSVIALEDLYYCAHNAVRSAQLGRPTVPSGFDPVANGGVIHERRHALKWALSPSISWDDTDLST